MTTATALALGLAACGTGSGDEQAAEGTGSGVDIPFTGDPNDPFASLFEQECADAPNDFLRQIVCDGEITMAEVTEMDNRTLECLISEGFTEEEVDVRANPYASQELGEGDFGQRLWGIVHDTSQANALEIQQRQARFEGCLDRTSRVWMLAMQRQNPENIPWEQPILECLVRHGIVDEAMTIRELESVIMGHCEWPTTLAQAERQPECWINAVELPGGALPPDPYNPEWFIEGDLWFQHNPASMNPVRILPGGANLDEGQALECLINPAS